MTFIKHYIISAQEESIDQFSSNLSVGLEKLVQGLKKEGIVNEVLHKILESVNKDISVGDKCGVLLNIADVITSELVMRKNLEKALEHENSSLAELRQVLQQKEMQVFELQTEIKRLQQVVGENKIGESICFIFVMSFSSAWHTLFLSC